MTAARRAGLSAVVLTVLAVGLMLVLIMLAARTGPQRIIHGTLVDPSFRGVDPSYTPPTLAAHRHRHRGQGLIHNNPVFTTLGWLIRLALLALVLWLLYRLARRVREAWVDRRRPPPRPDEVSFDVLDDPEPLIEEMTQDAADQIALLLGGTPRNAIVACWDRFEEQAERAHAARKPWETSSEFTLRLLERVSADPVAVSRLEALYREARFSEHPIDEPRRAAAVEALEAIHESLGRRTVRG
jgi:hypothetical protein